MCGILCCLHSPLPLDSLRPRVLERVRRLRHRGPDWSGVFAQQTSKGATIFAHERLAIVDVESGGQPLINEGNSIVVAVNGEIYNHKHIRSELSNPSKFLTESDCEIISHLYEEQKASKGSISPSDWLNRLNGIFAFVLLDKETDEFLIARDHMGIIPLYMGRDAEGAIWISSELKALCDICVTFEDFPPGHFYSSKTNEKTRWYNPKWLTDDSLVPTTPLDLQKIRTQLENAVRRQLMSDVPYGVLLSGGLDSSIIAAVASRICSQRVESDGKEQAWWPRLHSFSVGLVGSPDLAMARIVAQHVKTVHHEFIFTVEEGLDALSDVIFHLETYDVTTIRAGTPMYLMSRKIKCLGVKMVLSGEGSDEIFGGYLYFHWAPNAEALQRELVSKLKMLYKFDNLRANKSTASWGVEARVPFLDKEFLDFAMTDIAAKDKLCGNNAISPDRKVEKWVLRKAFEGYLPPQILWRQKEQFSDGVGYSWIDSIKAAAEKRVSDTDFQAAQYRFPHNTPNTKEAYYIRSIFEQHFPQHSARLCVPGGPSVACSTPAAIAWNPQFQKVADCSGRSVAGVHESAWDAKRREALEKTGSAVDIANGKSKGPADAEMSMAKRGKMEKNDTEENAQK